MTVELSSEKREDNLKVFHLVTRKRIFEFMHHISLSNKNTYNQSSISLHGYLFSSIVCNVSITSNSSSESALFFQPSII